jgi:hypothetical protein
VILNSEFETGLVEPEAGAAPDPSRAVYVPWGSLGGDIWEWWHADTVQREYEAVGKTPPTIEEIKAGASEDAARDLGEQVQKIATVGIGLSAVVLIGGALLFLAMRK